MQESPQVARRVKVAKLTSYFLRKITTESLPRHCCIPPGIVFYPKSEEYMVA